MLESLLSVCFSDLCVAMCVCVCMFWLLIRLLNTIVAFDSSGFLGCCAFRAQRQTSRFPLYRIWVYDIVERCTAQQKQLNALFSLSVPLGRSRWLENSLKNVHFVLAFRMGLWVLYCDLFGL